MFSLISQYIYLSSRNCLLPLKQYGEALDDLCADSMCYKSLKISENHKKDDEGGWKNITLSALLLPFFPFRASCLIRLAEKEKKFSLSHSMDIFSVNTGNKKKVVEMCN
jgi:hypothetical protein